MGEELDPGDHLHRSPMKFAIMNGTSSMKLLSAEPLNKDHNVLPVPLHASHMPRSPRKFAIMNCTSSLNVEPLNKDHNVLSVPLHASNGALSVNASMPREAFGADKSLQNGPALIPLSVPSYGAPVQSEKKFIVFDQSGDMTRYMLWSSNIPTLYRHSTSHKLDLQKFEIEADGSGGDEGEEEMHENTEEINALLYSDSSDEDYDEEEASTGHSPVETVASSASVSILSAKRRRINENEIDASLVDTASSLAPHDGQVATKYSFKEDHYDAESSCVKGGAHGPSICNKLQKRARIQETMSVLRKIIPGGKSKDAATLLDDAIHILKSLQTKPNYAATSM